MAKSAGNWKSAAAKAGTTLFVMWGAVTLVFLLVRLAPGDTAVALLGPTASPEQLAELRARLGLDQPLITQYLIYIRDLLGGDFGYSYRLGRPALDAVLASVGPTLALTFCAMLMAVVIGIPLGIIAGARSGSIADRVLSFLMLVSKSVPNFWLGIMLILIFARWLRLLPSFGAATPVHLILPALTLALPVIAVVGRVMRSSVAEMQSEPFILAARAKGLSEAEVQRYHVTPNSLLPVVTVIGLQLGTLIGGAVIVESVFSWPGIGQLLVQSVSARDYLVVQAIAITVALFVVVINLLTDALYVRLDPRIRLSNER